MSQKLLFSFDDLSNKDKALKKIQRLFASAGAETIEIEVDDKIRRTSGISYRTIHFTFADSQTVTMLIKRPGDIFKVKVNGRELPVRSQDDHKAAVGEIVAKLNAGRTAFQKRLAKAKVAVPKGMAVSRKSREAKLVEKRDDLKASIAEIQEATKALKAGES